MTDLRYSIFFDSSFFKGLIDKTDDFHKPARTFWERVSKQSLVYLTSNFILDETFTLVRQRCGRTIVSELRELLAGEPPMRILRVTTMDEANAWDWFLNDWRNLSFTDCVTFALMKRMGITRVATFDQHFKRAGFQMET